MKAKWETETLLSLLGFFEARPLGSAARLEREEGRGKRRLALSLMIAMLLSPAKKSSIRRRRRRGSMR